MNQDWTESVHLKLAHTLMNYPRWFDKLRGVWRTPFINAEIWYLHTLHTVSQWNNYDRLVCILSSNSFGVGNSGPLRRRRVGIAVNHTKTDCMAGGSQAYSSGCLPRQSLIIRPLANPITHQSLCSLVARVVSSRTLTKWSLCQQRFTSRVPRRVGEVGRVEGGRGGRGSWGRLGY